MAKEKRPSCPVCGDPTTVVVGYGSHHALPEDLRREDFCASHAPVVPGRWLPGPPEWVDDIPRLIEVREAN